MRRIRDSSQVHIVEIAIESRFVAGCAAEATCSTVGF